MTLHDGSPFRMDSLGVWAACVYELFIAIAMNVCLKARDSSPTRAKTARTAIPSCQKPGKLGALVSGTRQANRQTLIQAVGQIPS